MTDQTNAALIAEARRYVSDHDVYADNHLLRGLADALEAAELAETNLAVEEGKNAGYRAKNDQLAAVVEKVRIARGNRPACKEHPDGDVISCGWKSAVLDIDVALATAPADILRERDTALIEKERASIRSTIGAYSEDPADAVDAFDAAVSTIEKARQRREERA